MKLKFAGENDIAEELKQAMSRPVAVFLGIVQHLKELSVRNGQPPITEDMIESHPSHAVKVNLRELTGIKPYNYDRDILSGKEIMEALHLRMTVSPYDLLSLRPAKPEDYAAFLMKHIQSRRIYQVSGAQMGDNLLVADHSMALPIGAGATSLDVLVPKGVLVERIGEWGHGYNYEMVNGQINRFGSSGEATLYTDVADIMIKAGWQPVRDNFTERAQRQWHEVMGFELPEKASVSAYEAVAGELPSKEPLNLSLELKPQQ